MPRCVLFFFYLSLSRFRCLLVLASFFQGQGMLPYFANFRLLAEFSTPCVNQRYVPAHRWSGALMHASFHLVTFPEILSASVVGLPSLLTPCCVSAGSSKCLGTPRRLGPIWRTASPWQRCFLWSASQSCQSTTAACTPSTARKPFTWCPGVAESPGSAPASAWTSWTWCGCTRSRAAATKCYVRRAKAKPGSLRRTAKRIRRESERSDEGKHQASAPAHWGRGSPAPGATLEGWAGKAGRRCWNGPLDWPILSHENDLQAILSVHGQLIFPCRL